jgi:hypothetical protein
VLQSEYNFCLSPSRPLLLQFEYNFCLSPSRILLPQSECTFYLNPSRPYILPSRIFTVLSLLSLEKMCVVSCSLEAFWSYYSILKFPWKKIIKKSCSKKKEKSKKNQKKKQQRRGFVCVFLSFVWWCFAITFVSKLTSLAQSSLEPAYYHR